MIRARLVLAAGCCAAALLSAAGTAPVFGQEAIVLSGGAARALAHAGVLQGLERRGHDPEIVTGASMGAVIGALYAAGFPPDSIAALMKQQDWRELFAPMPVPFGGARALRHPVLRFQMSGTLGFGTRGFISDWRANRELVRLLFEPGARTRGHFDRLPRRFRTVATDLATGESVVLGRGDLARAVRASFAQPGFLAPVRLQGRVLVDGDVRDYLPIDVARSMGARTVIASDVIRPRALDPRNTSGFAATARSLDYMTVHGRPSSPAPDVLLLPDVDPTASPIVYPTDPTPFLRAGLDAAMHADLADAPRGANARSVAPLPGRLGGFTVEAANPATEAFVRRGLAPSARGAFDPSRLLSRVDRLYATGLFDGIWVSVEDTVAGDLFANGPDGGAPMLIARTDSRPGLTFLGAAGYDNDRGGRAWLALNHELALGGAPLEASLEGSADGVVKSAAFTLRLPTLLGPSLAWTAGAEASETHVRASSDVRRTEGWFGVEARTIVPGVFAALTMRRERVRTDTGPAGTSSGPQLRLGNVTPLVQVVGIPTRLEVEGRFGDFDYGRARLQLSRTFGGRLTAIAPLAVLAGASTEAPVDRHPALGDDHLIPALTWGEHRGKVLAAFGVDVSQVIPRRTTLVLRARAGRTDRQESFDPNPEKSRWIFGAGLSNLWWLPLGRIEAGFEAGTLGDRRASVSLGADF